ncbi:hypothetical protein PENANT_c001G10822 [Penicillium antarcticum]|uniref:Uncharacterized protein n=1 Tax=Penicillium antarcticum TaxID=416450 RepID=A0A1V6QNQ3_9EURO|nr:hypothetical protein PENANT_c001G10822 [Penicillium antarcticum]
MTYFRHIRRTITKSERSKILVLVSPDSAILQLETLEVPISLLPLILYRFSYCIQNVFILLDPVLFAASIYMTLGRLIRNFNAEKYSLIRINWLSGTFMASNGLDYGLFNL